MTEQQQSTEPGGNEQTSGEENGQQGSQGFSQQEMNRTAGNARKEGRQAAVNELLSELGVEKLDDLKSGFQSYQQKQQEEQSEVDRLKNDTSKKDERIKQQDEEIRSLKINNTALSRVAAVGGKAERAGRIMQLADFSGVEVTDGSPDSEAIDAALKAVLEDVTEFKAQAQNTGGGGSNPASGSGSTTERNPWSQEHRNLTEQGRIQRENPELADRLRREAS